MSVPEEGQFMTIGPGLRRLLFGLYHNAPISFEKNVYERDWDVLVLLDACRVDSLRTVSPEFAWLPDSFDTLWSVGTQSSDWMDGTFIDRYEQEISQTGYVTANPYSHDHVDDSALAFVDEVWRDGWDHDLGTVPADTVTERAIAAGRHREWERLIVHYMQPHFPSVPDPIGSGMSLDDFGTGMSIWDDIEAGRIDVERARESHLANLRYVLESVDDFRQNVDARKAVVSADHGECFGEWGFYGHPANKPIPTLRRVPWAEVETRDSRSIDPDPNHTAEQTSAAEVDERLRALGYK
jgi:hypothetical protein